MSYDMNKIGCELTCTKELLTFEYTSIDTDEPHGSLSSW